MSIYEDLLREMVPADDPLYETLVRFNEKILPGQMPEYPKGLETVSQTPAEDVITPTGILSPQEKIELNRRYGKLASQSTMGYFQSLTIFMDANSPYPKELTRKGRIRRWFRNYLYEHWGIR